MRILFLTVFIGFIVADLQAQVSYSNSDLTIKTIETKDSAQIICSDSIYVVKFRVKHNVKPTDYENFVKIDSQIIQIAPIKINGYGKSMSGLSLDEQKQILDSYSNYEIEYIKNEVGIEILNQKTQWVVTKSRGWLVWYFFLGKMPVAAEKPAKVQLYASTVIGDRIFSINAPIMSLDEVATASYIVNDMMEAITVSKSKSNAK